MHQESATVVGGAPGLQALVSRAVAVDAGAHARFKELGDGQIDVFVTTPFEVLASRRIEGEVSRDGAVVAASDLLHALQSGSQNIGRARDPNWPGALPPAGGFELLDVLPVGVVRSLADEGQALARQFSGPLGPPSSLMDQPVITVESSGQSVEIPMRVVFTCTSLGLIPGFKAGNEVPRHVRVSSHGRWLRVDAPFGTVYRSQSLGGVLPV